MEGQRLTLVGAKKGRSGIDPLDLGLGCYKFKVYGEWQALP
jgi:hypothetical protein